MNAPTEEMVRYHLYRSDLGRLTFAAAIFNNLVGWMVFAGILGVLEHRSLGAFHVAATIALTLSFSLLMLTVGRWLLDQFLPWVQAHASWPGGVLGFAISLALLAAGITEWIGIHAIFGAFLVGIAIGDSPRLQQEARRTILDFISFIFAPLFFASLGLRVDFIAKFDPVVVGSIVAIACVGKIVGCSLTARISGFQWTTSSALGFAMNARGAMAIILGFLALQNGLVRQRMFVALVIMAVATSMLSEPVIKRLSRRKRSQPFADLVPATGLRRDLQSTERWSAMEELAGCFCIDGDGSLVADSALWGGSVRIEWAGPNQEVAVCFAEMDAIAKPQVAVGLSKHGVDFGRLAEGRLHFIVLVATPANGLDTELALEDDIQQTFASERTLHELRLAATRTECLAILRASVNGVSAHYRVEIPVA